MKNQIKKALALKYPAGIEAPIIVAKGEGKTAEKIVLEAEKNEIHIEENAVLVDMLGLQKVGEVVSEDTWPLLADIFAFIMELGEKK